MMADDVQVENLEETDEVYVENLETDGVYVVNLEGHTKTGKEDELAMKGQSRAKNVTSAIRIVFIVDLETWIDLLDI